ncbi:MAG: aminotransferase class I/II-fold pyridoxal phosphate-dependent enzyme [Magnetococcales bacterium]|nr:aminotransferase class I/II-fold pyridoxal phosphate-dependent enzyme [Magnetococcales bacterium]
MWANKLKDIQPFHVMEVLKRAKELEAEGGDLIHLEVGEPDFPTPEPILKAAKDALNQDLTRYTPALGIPQLREAIAQWYKRRYNVTVNPAHVVVTPGTSGGFILALGSLLNPGDKVALADPGYPCYPNMIHFLGGDPLAINVGPESRYQLHPEVLKKPMTQGVRGVLITSPSNPTGTLIRPDDFAANIELVESHGGVVISDEIYHWITYEEPPRTALEWSNKAVVINGFSKYFAMTGWRLGWMIVPPDLLPKVEALAQNLFISATTISQYAALAAFDCEDFFQQRVQGFDQNRRFLMGALRDMGFSIPVDPSGAFYIYADASPVLRRLGLNDSATLCRTWLEEIHVAITPGLDFGHNRPGVHMRFSYAGSLDRIQEAVRRMTRDLKQRAT